MNEARNEFLNGLKVEEGETSQIEVAEEAIKKQLFSILIDIDLKNGETVELSKIVDKIADSLGLQTNKSKIFQHLAKTLKDGSYQFDIDDNGNVKANYNRLYSLQELSTESEKRQSNQIYQQFIEKAKLYASELQEQDIKVTQENLRNKFSTREQEFQSNWISLAIDRVLEMQDLEK